MTLRAIAGLETPDRGRIVLHERVLFDSSRGINVPARDRRIGLLFQHYALFPHLTVAQNIAFGLRGLTAAERARRVEQQLASAHLEDFASAIPLRCRRRTAARGAGARTCRGTAALLLDEPFPRSTRICAARSNGNSAKLWRRIKDRRSS